MQVRTMSNRCKLIIYLLWTVIYLLPTDVWSAQIITGPQSACYGRNDVPFVAARQTRSATRGIETATIRLHYTAGFPDVAKPAMQAAANVWATKISSSIPIDIDCKWEALEAPSDSYILAMCGPFLTSDFTNQPLANTYYPMALANKIAGEDLSTSSDMQCSVNSQAPWYYSTDGNPPENQVDLMTVALHEFAHGLGLSGYLQSGNVVTDITTFDRAVVNGNNQVLVETFGGDATALTVQLTSNNLFFNGAQARQANGGNNPKLYAPTGWENGSSIYHLDETQYKTAQYDLMTPIITNTIHQPDAIVLGMINDIGWGYTPPPPTVDYNNLYVNFIFGGPWYGNQVNPYNSFQTAITNLNAGGTIHISPGTTNWTGTITKAMTLTVNGTGSVTIGQ